MQRLAYFFIFIGLSLLSLKASAIVQNEAIALSRNVSEGNENSEVTFYELELYTVQRVRHFECMRRDDFQKFLVMVTNLRTLAHTAKPNYQLKQRIYNLLLPYQIKRMSIGDEAARRLKPFKCFKSDVFFDVEELIEKIFVALQFIKCGSYESCFYVIRRHAKTLALFLKTNFTLKIPKPPSLARFPFKYDTLGAFHAQVYAAMPSLKTWPEKRRSYVTRCFLEVLVDLYSVRLNFDFLSVLPPVLQVQLVKRISDLNRAVAHEGYHDLNGLGYLEACTVLPITETFDRLADLHSYLKKFEREGIPWQERHAWELFFTWIYHLLEKLKQNHRELYYREVSSQNHVGIPACFYSVLNYFRNKTVKGLPSLPVTN